MDTMSKEWRFKAITDIWTGNAERQNQQLILPGLLGSIRWWFEVVVRGLGGYACDPTVKSRCPVENKNHPNEKRHCVVCELFGCTGWARKFRFEVVDEKGQPIQNAISANTIFILRFTPLRMIRNEEWALLDLTLRLISEYTALGGKTVLKPSDEKGRETVIHHRDYGLIILEESPALSMIGKENLQEYMKRSEWRQHSHDADDFNWASLSHFWAVKGHYLARQSNSQSTFNRLLGRPEEKIRSSWGKSWLAGSQRVSKKIFSFKTRGYERTYGFVPNNSDFGKIENTLKEVWKIQGNQEFCFLTGESILDKLINPQGG